jgi:murein L,D-transpeptidase YafK
MKKCVAMMLLLSCGSGGTAMAADRISRIIVDKSDHELLALYQSGRQLKIDGLRFGKAWADGPKRRRGDLRTPEGHYIIDQVRMAGRYRYLPALHISYPAPGDVERARKAGIDPGDAILIHGPPFGLPFNLPWEWTDGCISMPLSDLTTLVRDTRPGTPVTIRP